MIAVIALVFAMMGGAYAANDSSDDGGDATASAKRNTKAKQGPRGPRGKQGKQGKAGPPGATGPAGAAGSAGAKGDKGDTGANGTNGTNGTNGVSVTSSPASLAECSSGGTKFTSASGTSKVCNGTFGSKPLPSEETLTGVYAGSGFVTGNAAADFTGVLIPITFAMHLEDPLPGANVHFETDAGFGTTCTGSKADPTAPPGHLCVYGGALGMTAGSLLGGPIIDPATSAPGAATSGAMLNLTVNSTPPEAGLATGTWAVTAP